MRVFKASSSEDSPVDPNPEPQLQVQVQLLLLDVDSGCFRRGEGSVLCRSGPAAAV